MKRPLPWIAMASAIASIVACSNPPDAVADRGAVGLPAASVTVAGGAPDSPMDSIHPAATPDDPAELAARLRDAQLPRPSTSDATANSR